MLDWQPAGAAYSNERSPVLIFFFNNLGCLGSLLVSAIGTLVLLLLLHVI